MDRINDFEPFTGVHCETTTTGNLLRHGGLELSEPMLFGLGEGLAFGVLVFKNAPAPFLAGRPRPEQITRNLADNLGFDVEWRQTRSKNKAWDNVASFIADGQPVGVKLDCFSLDYFDADTHFAGHYVTVHGYTDDEVLVVDTAQQGGTRTTGRDAFEEGRLWRGPMASNALSWTVRVHNIDIDWASVLQAAIVANAESYLNPPIRNFGAAGIRKAAELVPSWLETSTTPQRAWLSWAC